MSLTLTGTKVTPAGVERFKKNRQGNAQIMAAFRNTNVVR
jgi:hypothetical protein